MKCVEGAESESGKRASPIGRGLAGCNGDSEGFQPQACGKSPVFTRIPLVLEIVSGRPYQIEGPDLSHIKDRCHRLRFSSDPLDCRVVEWTLETADVEVGNLAHIVDRTTVIDSVGAAKRRPPQSKPA